MIDTIPDRVFCIPSWRGNWMTLMNRGAPDAPAATTPYYNGNTVKVTDPKGKWKRFEMDGLGRLWRVYEPQPGSGGAVEDLTEYTYDVFDKLKQVSMARGGTTQLRTFVYDGEQRLQSVTQPETGTVTYTYDALGRTSTKTDAKNQKIKYVYDSHSRVSEVRRYPVSTGAEDVTQRTTFSWDYSGARNGAGRVGLIQYGNGFYESFHYKVSGLVEEKGLWAPGAAAWLSAVYTYNNEGQRTSLKYPDVYDLQGQIVSTGRTINSTYDSVGRLASIRDPGLGGGTDMVSGAQYNAAGQLTQMTVAWEGTRTFNYNTLGQLTRQTSPGVDLEYIFPSTDNDGRLWKKKDWLSGEEVTYQYDEIGRLTAAATTGPAWGLSWTYDGFGNRLAQPVTKGSAPAVSVSVNAATNRVVGLGYDNNGNQTSWTTPVGPVTAAYDVDNRLVSISTPNGSEVYAYSSANQRLRKQGKLYFYGVGGELLVEYDFGYGGGGTNPLNPKTQVYFGGMLVFGEGDRRITTDRLGSTVRTEGYFQPEYRYRYYPYGEQQGGSSNEDQVKFGTYWRDSVSGLDYAQNRYFSASAGRFTSADPSVMSGGMGNPQGWNRYAYVENDPVNLTDSMGLQADQCADKEEAKYIPFCIARSRDAASEQGPILIPRFPQLAGVIWGISWFAGKTSTSEGGSSPKQEPECFAQLKYRNVGDWRAEAAGATHAFWWIQDRTGQRYVISAGPAEYKDSTGQFLEAWVVKGDANGQDKSGQKLAWSSGLSSAICDQVEKMMKAASSFPRRSIYYDPLGGPNSNSAANFFGQAGGFSVTAPPGSFGWGTGIIYPGM